MLSKGKEVRHRSKEKEPKQAPFPCHNCPYKMGHEFCFPCMKDMLGQEGIKTWQKLNSSKQCDRQWSIFILLSLSEGMKNNDGFDYFYQEQTDQFSFYRIPKSLFIEDRFRGISTDAKVLYGLLLDRVSLSTKNKWIDEQGRIYIIYTIRNIQLSLGCADKKATRLLAELEAYGLIEKRKRGQGKPTIIYVKNFIVSSKQRFKDCQNNDSRVVEATILDQPKQRCNYTDMNKTDYSDTNHILSDD